MKNNFQKFLIKIYGVIVGISILMGALVAFIFILAFIISGKFAIKLIEINSSLMSASMAMACLTIFIGLIEFYISKEHALTVVTDTKEK